MLREVPLHIMAGHDVITSKTAEVFGNHHIDLFGLNIGDHPLKARPVKVCSAPPIVNIGISHLQSVLMNEFLQQGFLVLYALGRSFVLILL